MGFGDRLRAERKNSNLTAAELAKSCGISRSYITLIENGQRLPSSKIMPKIALALDIKTTIVLNWYLDALREKVERKLELY
ncbi:MAG: helix-turn-helix transcriptional regulator [Candidatus Saccharibacteria bacterium]